MRGSVDKHFFPGGMGKSCGDFELLRSGMVRPQMSHFPSTSDEAIIGFHASHEQFSPKLLLELAQRAEAAGFTGFFSSDHFHPWGRSQGQSGFSFAWLAAALQATSLPARCICCPFGRYHPAIVAQAAATLAEMFDGRFALAIGSGQALNEHITGKPWPNKATRNEMLRASAEIIKELWSGNVVTRGEPVPIEEAQLFSRPEIPPRLFGAAVTPDTARHLSSWADGLLTTSRPPEQAREMISAFRAGGNRGDLILKVGLSYARTEDQALAQAHEQWRNAAFPNTVLTEVKTTDMFDELGQKVRPEDMATQLRISSSIDQHIQWIEEDLAVGYSEIYLHNVGRNQDEFIADFGKHVLPNFAQRKVS